MNDPYRFLKHKLDKMADLPQGPHFVVLHFTTRSESDPYDSDRSFSVPHVEHYCFTNPNDLSDFILECQTEKRTFAFYKVEKLGEAKLTVTTNITENNSGGWRPKGPPV